MVTVVDLETSKFPLANPWQAGSFLVLMGWYQGEDTYEIQTFNHATFVPEQTPQAMLDRAQEILNRTTVLVGHNLKFDLAWLYWLGLDTSHLQLFCTMGAEYILNSQRNMPKGYYGLDQTARRRGVGYKIKEVWEGVENTDQIDHPLLCRYLRRDLVLPYRIYKQQIRQIKGVGLERVVALHNETLRVLTEIEMVGMRVQEDTLREQLEANTESIRALDREYQQLVGRPINLGSKHQLSATLFGGTYTVGAREWFYAERRDGSLSLKSRRATLKKSHPGLGLKPLPKTEYKDGSGAYQVDRAQLEQLKPRTKIQKQAVALLLERAKVKKAIELLYNKRKKGLLTLIEQDGCIHTQYNQCITRTSRLSSSNPNLQNIPRGGTAEVKDAFISRQL